MDKRKVQSVIFYTAPDNKKHFLLLKMNERRKFHWQNVTGGVDEHENFFQAAIREAIEETHLLEENIISTIESKVEFKFFDQWKQNVIEKVFFIETKNKWDVIIDPSEHCDFKWVCENELHDKIVHFESNYSALLAVLDYKCES